MHRAPAVKATQAAADPLLARRRALAAQRAHLRGSEPEGAATARQSDTQARGRLEAARTALRDAEREAASASARLLALSAAHDRAIAEAEHELRATAPAAIAEAWHALERDRARALRSIDPADRRDLEADLLAARHALDELSLEALGAPALAERLERIRATVRHLPAPLPA